MKIEIEVTDIFDAFHEVAQTMWARCEFRGGSEGPAAAIRPLYDELLDQLERDLFWAACARRLAKRIDRAVSPDEIPALLRLHDPRGFPISGPAGEYQTHAFDHATPEDETVLNEVIPGTMAPQPRAEVRIFLLWERP